MDRQIALIRSAQVGNSPFRDCVRALWVTEGLRWFTKGLSARLLQTGIFSFWLMLIYEPYSIVLIGHVKSHCFAVQLYAFDQGSVDDGTAFEILQRIRLSASQQLIRRFVGWPEQSTTLLGSQSECRIVHSVVYRSLIHFIRDE
ncbi:hypothetical protein EG68_08695 [Paragonimus skrjabini miyazakii]|uniref:Uncharacterized protein n=1 Tax=Paragonimus skrjabini miyazakii TaxID=59628 RepID=A0A8S9YW12_9TREM|nr:hypothetical protein EG68_08695 [Paragonimus skrjabini miyazakii]